MKKGTHLWVKLRKKRRRAQSNGAQNLDGTRERGTISAQFEYTNIRRGEFALRPSVPRMNDRKKMALELSFEKKHQRGGGGGIYEEGLYSLVRNLGLYKEGGRMDRSLWMHFPGGGKRTSKGTCKTKGGLESEAGDLGLKAGEFKGAARDAEENTISELP